jgi:hypothetical protein
MELAALSYCNVIIAGTKKVTKIRRFIESSGYFITFMLAQSDPTERRELMKIGLSLKPKTMQTTIRKFN